MRWRRSTNRIHGFLIGPDQEILISTYGRTYSEPHSVLACMAGCGDLELEWYAGLQAHGLPWLLGQSTG